MKRPKTVAVGPAGTKTAADPAKGAQTQPRGANSTFTSVPVKPETLRRLKSYKVGGKTYDDILNEFMDETPTEEFIRWHLDQVKNAPRVPWDSERGRFAK